jgi:hypothetical protein
MDGILPLPRRVWIGSSLLLGGELYCRHASCCLVVVVMMLVAALYVCLCVYLFYSKQKGGEFVGCSAEVAA